MAQMFTGTIHYFLLKDKTRTVVDPKSMPADIRDDLCRRHNYWLDSMIGPNHDVAHYDMGRQGWRDMRNAKLLHSATDVPLTYNDGTIT